MATGILYYDEDTLKENDSILGSSRIAYNPWCIKISDEKIDHSNGQLEESSVKRVSYDLVQSVSDGDNIGSIIKAMTTEISQVNVSPITSVYNKAVWATQLPESVLRSANADKAKAKLVNDMKRLWDGYAYHGGGINIGVKDNPSHLKMSEMPMTSPAELNAAITAAYEKAKELLGVSDDDKVYFTLGYTTKISPFFTVFPDGVEKTARELISQAHPSLVLGQIPAGLTGGEDFLELYYRPGITLDHGAVPALYRTREVDEFTKRSTYVFETPKISYDEKGVIIRIPKQA
ncbi:TPA: hypothetical protein ACMD15_003397 [Vibrio cholerae]